MRIESDLFYPVIAVSDRANLAFAAAISSPETYPSLIVGDDSFTNIECLVSGSNSNNVNVLVIILALQQIQLKDCLPVAFLEQGYLAERSNKDCFTNWRVRNRLFSNYFTLYY